MSINLATIMLENTSILCASAVLSAGAVAMSPGQRPDHKTIWVNAAVQVSVNTGAGTYV